MDSGENDTLEQLIVLIGRENAKKVFEAFEGENIYFSKRIGLVELQNQIYEELKAGMSYGDAARKYGYSSSYIRKIERKINEKRRSMRQIGVSAEEPKRSGEKTSLEGDLFNGL